MPDPLLEVHALDARYGDFQALFAVSMTVAAGDVVAVIGANGAGKTTLLRSIAGVLPARRDAVFFAGEPIGNLPAHAVVARGIALVPEGRGILGTMTVQDNLLMGLYIRRDKAQAQKDLAALLERFSILAERRHLLASLMSGGEQQMLAIARALLSKPKLLLLDEPSLGLAPKMTDAVFAMIRDLRSEGLTVLLVEQKARQTLKIADRAYLMETGRVITSGAAKELIDDPVVSETFLGGRAATASSGHAG